MDDQIKINGYRIEPGEIENALQSHSDIESAAVIVSTNDSQAKELIAYCVGKSRLDVTDLRLHLSKTLPLYMMPQQIRQTDNLPVTSNGKIDKNVLLARSYELVSPEHEYAEPENETQKKLLLIWQQILNRDDIRMRDNFFDLGGNSIKVIKMISEAVKVFDRPIEVVTVFRFPTIESLSQFITVSPDIDIDRIILADSEAGDSVQFVNQTLSLLTQEE